MRSLYQQAIFQADTSWVGQDIPRTTKSILVYTIRYEISTYLPTIVLVGIKMYETLDTLRNHKRYKLLDQATLKKLFNIFLYTPFYT